MNRVILVKAIERTSQFSCIHWRSASATLDDLWCVGQRFRIYQMFQTNEAHAEPVCLRQTSPHLTDLRLYVGFVCTHTQHQSSVWTLFLIMPHPKVSNSFHIHSAMVAPSVERRCDQRKILLVFQRSDCASVRLFLLRNVLWVTWMQAAYHMNI